MRPSVGKGGTHGTFLVEVWHGTVRALARRFVTEAEGRDFYDRTVRAQQAKANRERVAYRISFTETRGPKSTETERAVAEAGVVPQ